MYALVYCFKLDEFEFNLKVSIKNTIQLYQGVQELCMQYICEFQIIKTIIHKVNNNLNFLLTRFFIAFKTEQYRIAFIEFTK